MIKKPVKFVAIFVVIVLVTVGMFVFSSKSTQDDLLMDSGNISDNPYFQTLDSIPVRRSFANGMHTMQGHVILPNPCYDFTHEVVNAESFPEQVIIDFTVIPRAEVCVQVLDEREFTVTFQASEQALITARINGEAITLSNVN